MNKRITRLMAALALLVFMTPSLVAWGQVTWTASEQGYTNAQDVTTFTVDSHISGEFAKASGTNAPKYYTSGTSVRMYSGNTLTLTPASNYQITKIEFTFNQNGGFTVSTGNYTNNIWTGTTTTGVTFTNGASQNRIQAITVTYSETGGPQPTTYTVTYNANVTGVASIVDTYNEGANVTLRPANTFTNEGYTFDEWNTDANGDGDAYSAGDVIEGIDEDIALYAIWIENAPSNDHWILTNLADLTASDVFVIVGNDSYAMSNDNGTTSAPVPVEVTIDGNNLTGSIAANIQWNVTGNATDGYSFLPNGTTEYLFCNTSAGSSSNNNLRIGNGGNYNRILFVLNNNDHLVTNDEYTARYVSLYNTQDWRGYTSESSAASMTFYKKVTGGIVPPSITANNVEIAYDATGGSIAYTINNGVEGGSLSASTTSDWLILGDDFTSPIAFTCSANEANTARTATVTLTYTYDTDQTVTKDVTITQASAPVIYTTIPALFEAATNAGNTATDVTVTFGDWVVTGANNSSHSFVSDGTNGFMIYGSGQGFSAGDVLSGTVECKVQLYNGSIEITQLTSTTTGLTVTTGGTVTVADIPMADLTGINTGALVSYQNLTCEARVEGNYTNYYLSDGTTEIQAYKTLLNNYADYLENGNTYNITGVFVLNNNTKRVNPRSAEDIEEVIIAEPSITVTPTTLNVDANEYEGNLSIAYENLNIAGTENFDVNFYEADGTTYTDYEWLDAEVVYENEAYSVYYTIQANAGEARTAYLKVYVLDEDAVALESDLVTINQAEYVAPVEEENYALFTGDLVEGDYLIVYDGSAMNNSVESDRLQYAEVTPENDVIATSNATIVWHIAPSGQYWTIYSADVEAYAASTGVKNKAQMLDDGTDDKAMWNVTKTEGTYEFVNKQNTANNVNANLRNNKNTTTNFGFACYGTGTGGALSLYKKVDNTPSITVAPALVEATAAGGNGALSITLSNMTISDDDQLDIVYYYATGEQITNQEDIPNWLECIITEDNDAYVVYYSIGQNMNTEAQTAYFKVYGIDDDGTTEAYSNLVTVTQAAAPQQFDLTVEAFENLELITFVNDEMTMETEGTIQVTEGAQVMLSIVADEGYVIETLMVNGVDHAADIAEDFTYTFEMPAEAVTISATAVEAPTPVGGDYVRITSLDQLTDGSKVVIAARYDEEYTNGYYAMPGVTSGKPNGVDFTSETSGNDEILPASIADEEETYYWTVNVTDDGYTFTNKENQKIGYSSGTNFATGGNNIVWTITRETADEGAMVAEYEGFVIRNGNTNNRAFAFNGTAFGAYATSNMNNSTYNFYLDFFVQSEAPVTETYTLHVNGYGDSEDGYVLLASPVSADPANTGMITDDGTDEENLTYDFYYFDQSQDLEWMNYREQTFNLVPGKGYLYANKNDVDLTFTGTPYSGDGQIALTYDENAEFAGWNLVGNPFGVEAKISMDYYALTPNVTELIPTDTSTYVASMQGVFVQYTNEAQTVIFTPVEVTDVVTSAKSNDAKVVLNVTHNRGNVIDRAIIRFGEGRQLSKFQLNPNHTKVYFPQGENDYAIVRSANEGEMPVNFKAENNGTYTFSVNAENVEMTYLHLIDNMTGADVDLLANPSYSFEAKTTDYASRFRLVFNANMVNENGNETFAYFNGSEWVVSNMGEATLQVVDMLGRIVSSETVNGNYEKSLNVAPGVYMIRLINGNDVKVQKMIVK